MLLNYPLNYIMDDIEVDHFDEETYESDMEFSRFVVLSWSEELLDFLPGDSEGVLLLIPIHVAVECIESLLNIVNHYDILLSLECTSSWMIGTPIQKLSP